MRVEVMALDQMRADLFHPFRLDFGYAACVKFAGFGELRRHDPFRAFLEQARAGVNVEFDFARALVVALVGFDTNIADQPGKQRAVNLLISGGRGVEAQAQLSRLCGELAVQVVPFAQPQIGKEMGVTLFQ